MTMQYTPNLGETPAADARRDVEYRAIAGFPGYRVGNDGSVWSSLSWTVRPAKKVFISNRWKRLKPLSNWQGKLRVALYRDGKSHYYAIHRLVLLAFAGPCPTGMEACHNDGDGANNKLSNLRWDTRINNEADKARHGTTARGERVGGAKLTTSAVIEIRRLYRTGRTQKSLAADFGVHKGTIHKIVYNKIWRSCAVPTKSG